jgi:hypothetical protein
VGSFAVCPPPTHTPENKYNVSIEMSILKQDTTNECVPQCLSTVHYQMVPSGKYFENALKFKSLLQNNGISAALLKQKLCESGM